MSHVWYEVWVDDGLSPPYMLLVLPKDENVIVVMDPIKNQILYESSSYEDVKLWLLEDEFRRVDGRMRRDKT